MDFTSIIVTVVVDLATSIVTWVIGEAMTTVITLVAAVIFAMITIAVLVVLSKVFPESGMISELLLTAYMVVTFLILLIAMTGGWVLAAELLVVFLISLLVLGKVVDKDLVTEYSGTIATVVETIADVVYGGLSAIGGKIGFTSLAITIGGLVLLYNIMKGNKRDDSQKLSSNTSSGTSEQL